MSGARSGAAATPGEAEKLAKALCRAGVVLRHQDTVFLRPAEVAAAVLQVGSRQGWSQAPKYGRTLIMVCRV